MSQKPVPASTLHRNGVGQRDRFPLALDPESIQIDERTIKDLLSFTAKFAKCLRYYDAQDSQIGNWDKFLDASRIEELAACAEDPDQLGNGRGVKQPHLALFLVFLELLRKVQGRQNQFTRRHLEYYYREILRMAPKPAASDRVHVLIDLAPGQEPFVLPTGTPLDAGRDSEEQDRIYLTDSEVHVSALRLAEVRSLFADREVVGIREAHQRSLARDESPEVAFMTMLEWALGDPNPGDLLALPSTGDGQTGQDAALALFNRLDRDILGVLRNTLHLPISLFRILMALRETLVPSRDPRWKIINGILRAASARKGIGFDPEAAESHPEDFETNFERALSLSPTEPEGFKGLPDVDTVYDLHRRVARSRKVSGWGGELLEEFIAGRPGSGGDSARIGLFMSGDEFLHMMEIVESIHEDWRRIYDLLQDSARAGGRFEYEAVERVDPPSRMIRKYFPDKFAWLVKTTLGETGDEESTGADKLKELFRDLRNIESSLHMPAESLEFIWKTHRDDLKNESKPAPWEWERVYQILESAHAAKMTDKAVSELGDKLESQDDASIEELLAFALGRRDTMSEPSLPAGRRFTELDSGSVTDRRYIRDELHLEQAEFDELREIARKPIGKPWNTVCRILERARRRMLVGEVEPPRREDWKNLYAARDATEMQVVVDVEGDDATRWRTFGGAPSSGSQGENGPARLGFAVASPVLALSEGVREITLTLAFEPRQFDSYRNEISAAVRREGHSPFWIQLSTEDGMLVVPPERIEVGGRAALIFALRLDQKAPPIMAPLANSGFDSPWPLLQVLLADIEEAEDQKSTNPALIKAYGIFKSLFLVGVELKAEVIGLTSLSAQSEDAVIDLKKAFEPFGAEATAGSRFYLGSPELLSKRIDRMTFNLEWKGVPENGFAEHYKNYETVPTAPKATISVKEAGSEPVFSESYELFAKQATEPHSIEVSRAGGGALFEPQSGLATHEDLREWNRFVLWELEAPDFQHTVYPVRSARLAAEYAAKAARAANPNLWEKLTTPKDREPDPKDFEINPPYTPTLTGFSVDYTASATVKASETEPTCSAIRCWHLHPFGCEELPREPGEGDPGWQFLPRYDHEGYLYLGLEAITAPQRLSLLFQMAEGSADPKLEPATVEWACLDGNRWSPLDDGKILADGTNGLINTGIVTFDLPALRSSTVMPPGLYWIRAAVAANSGAICDTVAIHPHAVRAVYDDRGDAASHYAQPLPPETIEDLVEERPEVAAVRQPYSSFDGRSAEEDSMFYIRSSERLRHKNRALTCWDYERLVLEGFPEIYKVKCLAVDSSPDPRRMGIIQVTVIPDIRGKRPFDPFEPRVPSDTLVKIEESLGRRALPTARFEVKNPSFVTLTVRLRVRSCAGFNPAVVARNLDQGLQRLLAPWAYGGSEELSFGGRINTSLIVNFAEELEGIDYVAGMVLRIDAEGIDPVFVRADALLEDVPGIDPDAVLVSARTHHIEEVPADHYEDEVYQGLDFMRIGFDFRVVSDEHRMAIPIEAGEPAVSQGIGTMVVGLDFEVGPAERN